MAKIQLIEARLDAVVFKNRHSTSERYLRRRIESVTWVFADNTGRETIGEERIGLSFLNNSLTGHHRQPAPVPSPLVNHQ